MIDLDDFDVLTFDCYGTLIDWETGLVAALRPILDASGVEADAEAVLVRFGALESELEAGPYLPYRAVLGRVLLGLGAEFGFKPTVEEIATFAASVGSWPAFPDSKRSLRALKTKYELGVISNVDDDLFAGSSRQLGDPFSWVITAQQVRSYKPSVENFERAFETIGVPRDRILHVAQSLFHDVEPAKRLGLSTVWVNRRAGKEGGGATPASLAVPDLEVEDLATLAACAGVTSF
ncbi:MAG TPA: haloacid dehalogenase type II [Candidatus Polarisedimenticolaceae bacterium]|nr:haloacid dehalogenase type II [Candidatus Polarisedimenticolaceae bacterium]